ncbi:MAG: hypothetical protein GY771_10155, partial [bacterium]|nr:hypothetical protein [bacterium]
MYYSPLEYACDIFDALFAEGDIIYDHIENGPTPPDHYAYTFAALAGTLLYKRTGCVNFKNQAERLLNVYFGFSDKKLGHWEFNIYALAEIHLTGVFDNSETNTKIVRYLRTLRWQSGPGAETSYNWLALRALYHYIAGVNQLPDGDVEQADILLFQHVLKRQTEDGFFYDYSFPNPENGIAAPLTYHAKICFCLLRYWELSGDPDIVPPLIKALRVLNDTIFSTGDAFWYGRTNGGLFGYAAALYAFATAISSGLIEGNDLAGQGYNKLLCGLARMRRKDGTFALNHYPGRGRRPGWDDYMFHTVYNAYAAALFALAPDIEPPESAGDKPSDISFDIGLHVVRDGNDEAAFAINGQMVPGQGGFFADGRYIGMQPMLIYDEKGAIIPPPPYDSSTIPNSLSPRDLGFVPVLRHNEVDYAPHVYGEIAENDGVITGTGQSIAIEYQPFEELSPINKLGNAVIGKLTGRIYNNMRIRRLPGVEIRRALMWLKEERIL